jgi:AbrB family looped-hinge helix DNA binding protein
VKHTAKLSSKYQASIPTPVREALGLQPGDRLVFEVDDAQTVTLRRYPTLDELAGSVPTPPDVRGLSWSEIRERAWTQRARTATAKRSTRRR